MKFKDTCLYSLIREPVDYFSENNFYYYVLRIPFFIFLFTFGILIAVGVDIYVAYKGED